METHDALICDWAFNGMWLRQSIKLKFERRSLVKPVYKMDNERIDLNTLFSYGTLRQHQHRSLSYLLYTLWVLVYTRPLIYTLTMKRLEDTWSYIQKKVLAFAWERNLYINSLLYMTDFQIANVNAIQLLLP